ncbi:hypothetical protein M8818_005662 [Zalaria obscura]|uniref:Uncharacterized protein n=1 Tax=Zalaria obscura TaxID=2024903 RepID=A0ACC3S970_9PEZI
MLASGLGEIPLRIDSDAPPGMASFAMHTLQKCLNLRMQEVTERKCQDEIVHGMLVQLKSLLQPQACTYLKEVERGPEKPNAAAELLQQDVPAQGLSSELAEAIGTLRTRYSTATKRINELESELKHTATERDQVSEQLVLWKCASEERANSIYELKAEVHARTVACSELRVENDDLTRQNCDLTSKIKLTRRTLDESRVANKAAVKEVKELRARRESDHEKHDIALAKAREMDYLLGVISQYDECRHCGADFNIYVENRGTDNTPDMMVRCTECRTRHFGQA